MTELQCGPLIVFHGHTTVLAPLHAIFAQDASEHAAPLRLHRGTGQHRRQGVTQPTNVPQEHANGVIGNLFHHSMHHGTLGHPFEKAFMLTQLLQGASIAPHQDVVMGHQDRLFALVKGCHVSDHGFCEPKVFKHGRGQSDMLVAESKDLHGHMKQRVPKHVRNPWDGDGARHRRRSLGVVESLVHLVNVASHEIGKEIYQIHFLGKAHGMTKLQSSVANDDEVFLDLDPILLIVRIVHLEQIEWFEELNLGGILQLHIDRL